MFRLLSLLSLLFFLTDLDERPRHQISPHMRRFHVLHKLSIAVVHKDHQLPLGKLAADVCDGMPDLRDGDGGPPLVATGPLDVQDTDGGVSGNLALNFLEVEIALFCYGRQEVHLVVSDAPFFQASCECAPSLWWRCFAGVACANHFVQCVVGRPAQAQHLVT
jgi:hypothetical protein